MNQMYGFEGEVKAKYNEALTRLFTDTFNYLPLAHLLRLGAERVLVMHGGLFSDDDVTLKQLVEIDRVHQPPESGLMCEILWSDPQFSNGALLPLSPPLPPFTFTFLFSRFFSELALALLYIILVNGYKNTLVSLY